MRKQPPIPGLEVQIQDKTNADSKHATVQEQIKALRDRMLHLELEMSLLRIQVENPKGDKDYA